MLISSTACAGGLIQLKNVLPDNGKQATGSFGNRDGCIGAVELASTAFDAAPLKGQQCFFIAERQNSVRADFYTGPTP
jgi:hypothetical protein